MSAATTFRFRAVVAVWFVAGGMIAAAQAPLPQPKTQGTVTYLNGGVGSEEEQFIKASMKDFPLALVFARTGGEYVASIAVTIKDGNGTTVFETPSAGPYLLVKLPPGAYSVTADNHGDSKTRPVTVGTRPSASVGFTWP